MSDSSQWHYTDKSGQQAGPVPSDELLQLIASKTVPTSAMAWKDGMANWKPVSQIEELQTETATVFSPAPQPTPPSIPAPSPTETPIQSEQPINPYETPQVPSDEEFYAATESHSYGGLGRLAYFLLSIVVGVITQVVTVALGGEEIDLNTSYMITGVSFVVSMFLSFSRLQNIGMSRWWYLGNFVPILNFFVSVWIMSRQEGWVETERLDTAGKVIAWIMWSLIILAILAAIAALIFLFTIIQA